MQTFRLVHALVLAVGVTATPLAWCVAVQAQASNPALAAPAAPAPSARPSTRVATAPAAPRKAEPTRPAWNELTPAQQQALAPLSGAWATISEAQKRKWLALSQNYPKLPQPEQAKLHSRMTEWVALSPQQRTQARLNFAETKTLAPDDKKAKWEAYQALSPEEKRKLAAGAQTKPPATAAAVKPVPAQKLATVPKPRHDAKPPRIATGPLPEPGSTPLNPALAPAGPN